MQTASLTRVAIALAAAVWAGGCALGPDWHITDAGPAGGQVIPGLKSSGPAETSTALASSTTVKDPISLATKATPSPELYVAAARLSEQSGKLAEAERHYEKALQMDPRHAGALVSYARLKDRQGQMQEAIHLYQRAAKADPNDASILNDLGLCFARGRRFPESIAALERATQLEPKKLLYRNNLAMVLVETGEVEAAVSHLKAVQGEAVAHYNVGYILQKKGDSKAAARHFAMALEKNPSLVAARIWLERLEGQPGPMAESSPQVASDRQFDSGRMNTTRQPAPPRGADDGTREPAAVRSVAQTQSSKGQTPQARQLPPVTDNSPKTAALPRELPPISRYGDPAPLPLPSSVGQPAPGDRADRAGIPVVHPLPPVHPSEAQPGPP